MNSPANLEILVRAEALANDGVFDKAVRLCDRVIAEDADDAAALNLKGFCFASQGRSAEALPLFRLARSHLPDYPAIRYNLGKALEETGDTIAALAEYDETLRLDGDHADARISRATLRAVAGDVAGAGADFDELIRRDQGNARAYLLRGGWHLASRRYAEAHPDLRMALELDPDLKPAIDALTADVHGP